MIHGAGVEVLILVKHETTNLLRSLFLLNNNTCGSSRFFHRRC
jgi:hypothetical protein